MASTEALEAIDVLDFWLTAGYEKWFSRSDAFDASCREYTPLWERARRGDCDAWQATAAGSLALIILLDQIPRNIFRGEARQFETDAKALEVAKAAVAARHDKAYGLPYRVLFYMPYEHSEDMDVQRVSLDLFRQVGDRELYYYALIHADAIERFGRFPHRNTMLGRETTPQEKAYLASGGFGAG